MADNYNDSQREGEQVSKYVLKATHETKCRELLHKINLVEIKLCSDASKEFIKLLGGNSGGEFLRSYVRSSCSCSELLNAWGLHRAKPGMLYIFKLISSVLSHSAGKYISNDKESIRISRHLDKLAQSLIEEHLQDVYKELNSKVSARQKAALSLMASIVSRGHGLASEVAKNFDFKIQEFSKLAQYKQRQDDKKSKLSLRKDFVAFAMSFLEVGKPGLLRWILQQKEMYSGVLRGLSNDDDDTIIYVLSTLRDCILIEESLVPPGLRSVLFGSVTLEQLVNISGREKGVTAAELAHNVLVLVCTDPNNGLMPDLMRHPSPLRGNPKRLIGLMKKLKTNEIGYHRHRDLLLAIVNGRPSFGAAYMEEFPYNLEDYAAPNWFLTVIMAANLVSSVNNELSFGSLDSQRQHPDSFDNVDVQSIMKCLCPRSFSRSVINKGLLHSDFLVKHGTLKLLLEALKLLDSLIVALDCSKSSSNSNNRTKQGWSSLNQEIQDEVRTLFPDPQVFLTLLSSLSGHSKTQELGLKRKADFSEHRNNSVKKLKTDTVNDKDLDIIVSGMSSVTDISLPEDSERVMGEPTPDVVNDALNVIAEIWGLDHCSMLITPLNADIYFYSKLLDALKIYFHTMPTALEGSFEYFMNLLSGLLFSQTSLQHSLLSLLMEYIEWSPSGIPIRAPPLMYKHLQPLIYLSVFSPVSGIQKQAHRLSQAAMLSTGAFDRNSHEIASWFLFLPGYDGGKPSVGVHQLEVLQGLCQVVISFLCDAISTTGNNLFKYWDTVRRYTHLFEDVKDFSPEFGPLIVCILQKCLRLLDSESGTFTFPEKSLISLYVCNTLKYILQTQVDARLLSSIIGSILTERVCTHSFGVDDSRNNFCEWRPLKDLLLFSQSIQKLTCVLPTDRKAMPAYGSFAIALSAVKSLLKSEVCGETAGTIKAFYSTIICTAPEEILENFPSLLTISQNLSGVISSLLPSLFFLQQYLLTNVSKVWPKIFFTGLEMAMSSTCRQGRGDEITPEMNHGVPNCDVIAREMVCDEDFDANEIASTAGAFNFFLKLAPFHILFPAMMTADSPYLLEPMRIQDLLLAKLSECTSKSCLLSSLRLLLFWIHQIHSSYKTEPLVFLHQLNKLCFILIKKLLGQLLVLKHDFDCSKNPGFILSSKEIQEVAETIFSHPTVMTSVSCPLGIAKGLVEENLVNDMDSLIYLSGQGVHELDHHVLGLLGTTAEYLFFLIKDHHVESKVEDHVAKQLVKSLNLLVEKILHEVRMRFDVYIGTRDLIPLLPAFYALHTLIHFVSPFKLLELVRWMFNKADIDNLELLQSSGAYTFYLGLCIAACAFRKLSGYLTQPKIERVKYDSLWETEKGSMNINIIKEIYSDVCKLSLHFGTDYTDSCLLETVNAIRRQKFMQYHDFHPFGSELLRLMMTTPVKMLSYCICRTNKKRAELLFLLTDASSLHLSIFGHLFLGIVDKNLPRGVDMLEEVCDLALSDEDYMMLLPAALSYLNSALMKFGKQHAENFRCIPSIYSSILLNRFLQWKSFVSGSIFQKEYGELLPSSTKELLSLVNDSLLGKSLRMLQYHFALSGDSIEIEKWLELLNSIFPHNATQNELIDCDYEELDSCSLSESLNVINRVVAKISLCRMLLYPCSMGNQSLSKEVEIDVKEVPLEMKSNKFDSSRIQLVNILAGIWQWIVKKSPSVSDGSKKGRTRDNSSLYKLLEAFILKNIFELSIMMRDTLVDLESIPFLEQLMKSALVYRFEDFSTLRMLRGIITTLSAGKFSREFYFHLLLAHSQFAPTIRSIFNSSSCLRVGAFSRPMSGVLKSLATPSINKSTSDDKCNQKNPGLYSQQLEIVKLLRTLLPCKADKCAFDIGTKSGINFRELHLLLLSSYDAKISEIDIEIYNLMHTIESIDGLEVDNLAGLDYTWGHAALKIEKERTQEKDIFSEMTSDVEAVKERHRSHFRENLPIDPRICASTIVNFPYYRSASHELLSLNKFQAENSMDETPTDIGNMERYDPVFILRLSLHSLLAGYIDPMEFTSLGLLAIALVSMSSPDESIRRLAYDTLGGFQNALEQYQKRKDMMRIRLMLAYLRNGIEEPYQRIPSVIAIFSAEASLILLDPSHDHYSTLIKLLTRSSRLSMKNIPLFNDFFWSSSINFKAERLWILRLIYAGLNLDDDAQIYIRNSILESLMSFYVFPLSDNEARELILQVVKKSVKFHKLSRHLVKTCGLFSWLSSIISFSYKKHFGDEESFFFPQLAAVLEVVNYVIESRNITEWLQKHALEQLMELMSHLWRFLVGGETLIRENVSLVDKFMEVMMISLKLSQKRKLYQPHYNISTEGLYQLYGAICERSTATQCANVESGLKVILMSTPPVTFIALSQEKLSSFVAWAISSGLQLESAETLHHCSTAILEDVPVEDCLMSKLLRWLIAAVILGKLPRLCIDSDPQTRFSLQSLLESFQSACGKSSQNGFGCEEFLASTIIYLQQLVGIDFKSLPSVICALSLLLYNVPVFAYLLHDHMALLDSLWSKIRCPAEANPSWRWTFYQPWKDLTLEISDTQKMDELHACQILFVIFSNALGSIPSKTQLQFTEDVEKLGVFEWETGIVAGKDCKDSNTIHNESSLFRHK